MFDNRLEEVANYVWIWTGSTWCLSGPLKRLAYKGSTFLCYSTSLHLTRSMGDWTFSSISLTGLGDRRLFCFCHSHVQIYAYSQLHGTTIPLKRLAHSRLDRSLLHQSAHYTRYLRTMEGCMKLVLVSFTLIYTQFKLHVHHLTLVFVQGTCS